MAATVTWQHVAGNQPAAPTFIERLRVQGDASYPAGGYALNLAAKLHQGGKTIVGAFANAQVASSWGFSYDRTNDKLMVIDLTTGAEVVPATDLSTMDAELVVISR